MPKRLRVCIATTSFPRWLGDVRGTFIYEAARFLAASGVDIQVVAMHNPGAQVRERMGQIEVYRPRYLWPESLEILQKEGGGLPIMWQKSRLARLAILPFFVAHTTAIARVARSCDLIHANWTLSGAAAVAGRIFHKRPIILTVQGSDIVRAARLPIFDKVTSLVLQECRRVLALSHSLAQAVASLGLPVDRIEIVPNGVDVDYFSPPLNVEWRKPLVLFVGALSEIKGCTYLVEAMPQVLTTNPDASLVIVGEGPQRSKLEALAASLGVKSRIRFVGPQSPPQIRDWMRQARVFVLPSLEEGLGVVLLEALACGTPCIGSQVGGIPDVIVPGVGQLTPAGDSAVLAQAIQQALALPRSEWQVLSQSARRRAENYFSWDKITQRLIGIYQEVLEGKL